MSASPQPLTLVHHGNRALGSVRLFCFPYAGGGSLMFRDWPEHLPDSVDLCTIELPGRERLLATERNQTPAQLLARVDQALSQHIDRPYVLFGCSMGALMSYLIARSQCERGLRAPSAMFVAAHRAPHLPRRRRCLHELSDAELIHALAELRGTPMEVLDNRELIELYLPVVRLDLRFSETYEHEPGGRLPCPIYAFGGVNDRDVNQEEMAAWRAHTVGRFRLEMIEGDHFFLHRSPERLLGRMREELNAIAQEVRGEA